jgi:enterobacterial common antigen flippase
MKSTQPQPSPPLGERVASPFTLPLRTVLSAAKGLTVNSASRVRGFHGVILEIESKPNSNGFATARARFAKHFATTAAAQVTILAIGSLTGVLAARLLGPQGRGELAALTLWPSTLVLLASMGINQAIVFYTGRQQHTVAQVWTAGTLIGLGQSACVVAAGFFLIPVALAHYSEGVRHLSLAFLAASPLVVLGGYPANLLQGRLALGSFNLVRMTAPAVYAAGLLIVFALGRSSLGTVVSLQILGIATAMGLGYILLVRKTGLRVVWDSVVCRNLLTFGSKTQLANVSYYVNQSMDQLVLSLFVPARELGLYVVAVTLASAVCFLPQAAGIVTLATGSSSQPAEARTIIANSFRVSLLALVILCAVLYFAAPWLIAMVFGPSFAGAALACRILLLGMIAVGLCQVLYDGARALGQPALPAYTETSGVLVTCVSLWLLVPRWGFVGAAIASTLTYFVSLFVMLILCRARMQIGLGSLLGVPARRTPEFKPSPTSFGLS